MDRERACLHRKTILEALNEKGIHQTIGLRKELSAFSVLVLCNEVCIYIEFKPHFIDAHRLPGIISQKNEIHIG
jgi:hypothetical protein